MAEADMMNNPVGQKPVYWDPYDPGIFAEPYPVLKRLRDDGEMLKIFEPYRIDVMAVP